MKRIVAALLLAAGCAGGVASDDGADLRGRPVDRPGRKHTPTRNAAGGTMEYFGGPVIPNAKVYVVWWGNPANLNPAITAAHGGIADFYAGVLNSSFIDWLNEYDTNRAAQAGSHVGQPGTSQFIGRGNYAGTFTLSNIPSGNVTDAQIQATLDQAFSAGTLPQPDENAIFAVYFPSSVSITLDGSQSCAAFGAYHEAIVETARHNAYYLVMPDCGDSFSGVTDVSSHELVEAITDGQPTPGSNPDYPQAWNDSSGSETGDLCQSSSGTVATAFGTFTVQGIWDERSQGCKVLTTDARDFSVAVSPNSATVASGAQATFTVQTATTAGAAQPLALSVSAPAGLTATLSAASVTSGGSATLTVSASGAARNGQQIIVRADGVTTHTAALLVNVSGVSGGNDFSLAASPAALTVAQGGSGSASIATAVTSGSAGAVSLSASVSPAGPVAQLGAPSVTAGGSTTLTVSAGASVSAGSYTVTITGVEGAASHSATIALTVTSGGGGGGGLVNGGFESALTGWTVSGLASAVATAHGGSNAAQVGSTGPTTDSSIAQTFTAPAGAAQLSFWYEVHCPDTITYDWATATLKDNTAGTTATVLAKTCTNAGAWKQATAAVTAGHSYTLTLSNHDDNYASDPTYTWYDDVTISGVAASDFSVSVSPASLSVQQGASGTATVSTAIVSGSAQSVALSASGLPSGVTASFSPASVTAGASATLTLSASSAAAAGAATVTITGTAASGAHTAALSLTVTAVVTGGGVVNGGFESGSLSGWTPGGAVSAAVNSGAHSGTWAVRLGSTSATNGDSSVAQTFTAPSGKTSLSFWFKTTCPDTVTYDWATATLKDNTAGTTATVLAKTCTAAGAWTQKTAAVTAGHSYTLTLISHDDNYSSDPTYTLYDDVTLQ